jgi:hypothetical protein
MVIKKMLKVIKSGYKENRRQRQEKKRQAAGSRRQAAVLFRSNKNVIVQAARLDSRAGRC